MNEFQNQLQKVISEINKASQRVVLAEKIEQLDLDVLLERIRKAYCLVIDLGIEEDIIMLDEELLENEEEKVEEVEEIKAEENLHQEIEVKETKEEEPQEELEIIEENQPRQEEELIQESLFEQENTEDIQEEEEIFEPVEEKEEIPSVLKYLNEEVPKSSSFSSLFQAPIKEEEVETPKTIVEEEIIEEKQEEKAEEVEEIIEEIEEKISDNVEEIKEESAQELFFESSLNEVEQPKKLSNSKPIGEQYEQKKSIFENISDQVKQEDISKRFNNGNIDLRTAIGVNEKFMFITDLFSGNLREYTDFIQKLNEAETKEEANLILNIEKENKRWAGNSLAFTTLAEILTKKFH